jgi:hypothetical protein
MKKLLILFLFCVMTVGAYSQNSTIYYEVKGYLNGMGYTVDENNVWYQNIQEGEFFYCYKTFSPGLDYVLFAFSEDGDVKDIDIYLYNQDNSIYNKDADIKSSGLLEYTVRKKLYNLVHCIFLL